MKKTLSFFMKKFFFCILIILSNISAMGYSKETQQQKIINGFFGLFTCGILAYFNNNFQNQKIYLMQGIQELHNITNALISDEKKESFKEKRKIISYFIIKRASAKFNFF